MSLRHAMLGLLAHGPASGYGLLKTFEISLAHVWPATRGQLCAELGRLTDAGLVSVAAQGPRGREDYTLTAEGLTELRRWLTEVEPDVPRRNEALLRVFFLDLAEPAQARGHLERRAAAASAMHDQLLATKAELTDETGPLSAYGQLTLEYGLRLTEMTHEWALWAAGQLNSAAQRAESGVGTEAQGNVTGT